MSNTIQSHSYSARHVRHVPQPPSALTDAREHLMHDAYTRAMHALHERNETSHLIAGLNRSEQCAVKVHTAETKFAAVPADWPTTAAEIFVDVDEFQKMDNWTCWAEQAEQALQKAASKSKAHSTAAPLRVQRLAGLQAAFGFSVQDLAAVLGITRQGLYKWLDESNQSKLQEANSLRLAVMERIAKEWSTRSTAPLSSVSHEVLANGNTLFSVLIAGVVDEADVCGAFGELVAKLQATPKTRSQRLHDAGFTRRASARSLPSDD